MCIQKKIIAVGLFLALFSSSLSAQMSVIIQIDQHPQCHGSTDGVLTAIVSPVGAAYSFSWSDGATTSTNTDLSAGAYSVTVQNAAGAVAIATAILDEPDALVLTALTELPLSVNPTGNVDVETSGGTEPFAFQWTDQNNLPFSNSEDLIDAPAGVYTQTATDANGCTATLTPVELILTSGVDDLLNAPVRLFPNPAVATFTVEQTMGAPLFMQVFDASGVMVESRVLNGAQASISVENWPSGRYAVVFPGLSLVQPLLVVHP